MTQLPATAPPPAHRIPAARGARPDQALPGAPSGLRAARAPRDPPRAAGGGSPRRARGPRRRRGARGRGRLARAARGRAITAVVGESGSGKSTLARLLCPADQADLGPAARRRPARCRAATAAGGSTRARCRWCCRTRSPPSTRCTTCGTTWPGRFRSTGWSSRGPAWTTAVTGLLERVALTPADQFLRQVPARAVRRPAAAGRDRPGARGAAAGAAGRRAGLDARRLDPARHPQPARRPARRASGSAILYITHDIASARYLADTIVVMYAGQVVESGPAQAVTDQPAHPYTQLLLSAAPDPDRLGPPALRRPRRPAQPGDAAAGLPVPPALPARDGGLRRPPSRPRSTWPPVTRAPAGCTRPAWTRRRPARSPPQPVPHPTWERRRLMNRDTT